jgi:hypothetical protein
LYIIGAEALGTEVVITGSGFMPSAENNSVLIGGIKCNVTSANETTIRCYVGNGPTGSYDVIVLVDEKGFTEHIYGAVKFNYTSGVQYIRPTSGSLGGK